MLKRLLLALGLLLAPADAFAQSSKLSNLTAGGAIAGTDLFYDVQSVGIGGVKVTGTQLSTFVLTPPVNVPLGTVTTNTLGVNVTGTWNNAAQVFDAPLFMNITDTASASGSLMLDIQRSGATLFNVGNLSGLTRANISVPNFSQFTHNGTIYFTNDGTTRNVQIAAAQVVIGSVNPSSGNLAFASTTDIPAGVIDLFITRDAAGTLAQVNGGSAQTFRVYNTSSGANVNFERGVFDWTTNANVLTIGTQKGGTGSSRNIQFVSGGTAIADFGVTAGSVWTFNNSVSLVSGTNLVVDQTIIFNTVSGEDTGINRTAAKVLRFNDGTTNPNGWMQWAGEARVAADVTNTTTTLATATGLSAALQAGRTYSFEVELPFTDAAAGGIQAALVATGGLTATNIIYDGWIVDSAANGIKGNAQAAALGGVVASAVTAGTAGHVTISGTITVNVAGTLNVQFAQNTSNATATTIKRGAYMWLHDMP